MVAKAKILIISCFAVLFLASRAQAAQPDAALVDIEGNWFSCEFAHSQIPPEDDCNMFDDDGFDVSGGEIFHIKVVNSTETGCRHQRKGQCFKRSSQRIVVNRDSVGTIRATSKGFAIKYWGCTQEYTMGQRGKFFEVAPTGKRCLWTREKKYFIARYQGNLQIGKN